MMIHVMAEAPISIWWAGPAIAGLFTLAVAVLALAASGTRDRRDRRRKLYADAHAAVAAYWEYPYVILDRKAHV